MRLTGISTNQAAPILKFEANDLSSVVILAGPNGVGKSRLIAWLLSFLQSLPSETDNWIVVEATSDVERMSWQKPVLDSRAPEDAAKLKSTLQRKRHRYGYTSSVLNFESDRKIAQIKPYTFNWNYDDPYEEEIDWNYGFRSFSTRWQDTVHTIFRKVRSRREKIAARVDAISKANPAIAAGVEEKPSKLISIDMKDFPDPIDVFKEAFDKLLGPKTLCDPDPQEQKLFYEYQGEKRAVETLSSGEREVVNIVFDFLLQNPTDCIVVFDEPELHLHPELSYRLLSAQYDCAVLGLRLSSVDTAGRAADVLAAGHQWAGAFCRSRIEAGHDPNGTGARLREILHVDFERGLLLLPTSKTGKKPSC